MQNREDGKNVGGWHWEEKNMFAWSKQLLEELFAAIPPPAAGDGAGAGASDGASGAPRITRLRSCTGEALITTRKGGKRLAIWDLNLTVEWAATAEGSGKEVKGAIDVKEFSSAHDDDDDLLLEVSAEGSGGDHERLKAAALAGLKPAVLAALAEFGRRLHAQE